MPWVLVKALVVMYPPVQGGAAWVSNLKWHQHVTALLLIVAEGDAGGGHRIAAPYCLEHAVDDVVSTPSTLAVGAEGAFEK
jgi:hypothetical protein